MEITAPALQAGLSISGLIAHADPIVKGVMLVLGAASILCWAISFEKLLRYVGFARQLRLLERSLVSRSHDQPPGWLGQRFEEVAEAEPQAASESRADLQIRLERSFGTEIAAQARRLQSGLALLATVGSTAPFVGLFGTVWGIMNSFTGIAAAKDTSLAVVAPGIAEALLATAMGLVAAIPAVIFYNLANVFLTNSVERLAAAANRFAKLYAYETNSAGVDSFPVHRKEKQALTNGGINAR